MNMTIKELQAKYPTARDPETLNRINFIMRIVLPEQKII